MQSERFRKLLHAHGPFASVYFDDSHDTHDAEAQLELKWRAIKDELEQQGADHSVVDAIGDAVRGERPAVGRSGRTVIAGPDGVLLNEHLARPAATSVVRVSELPYVVPILEQSYDHPDYVLVVVDHSGADLTTHLGGALHSETVGGGGGYPVHHAERRRNGRIWRPAVAQRRSGPQEHARGRRPGGRTRRRQRNRAGLRGGRGPVALRLRRRPARTAPRADRGAGRRRPARRPRLRRDPARHRNRVPQAPAAGHRRCRATIHRRDRPRVRVGRRGPRARVLGPPAGRGGDTDHRRHRRRDGGRGRRADHRGPDANVLSEQGAAPDKTLRADEALPMFAVSIGASLVRTDERITPADGVAAVLRYAPTLH